MADCTGVYRAVCLEVTADRVRCQVPQLFADETVTCFDVAGSIPVAGQEGFVSFESGQANKPVWMGSQWQAPVSGGGGTGTTDHHALTNLAVGDDHPQYLQPGEVNAGTGISVAVASGVVTVTNIDLGSVAVTNHVALADPHTQYLQPGEVHAGTGISVAAPGDGTVTITATGGGTITPGSVVAETTFGGTSADGVAATFSRSDHKHANPLHDDAAHSAVHLNALAPPNGVVSFGGFPVSNMGAPTNAGDGAPKAYVDLGDNSMRWKAPCRVASTANITTTTNGLAAIDGVTLNTGDRVLLKNQTTPAQNGIYVAAVTPWIRPPDADGAPELDGAFVFVRDGTAQAQTVWFVSTTGTITPSVTAHTWLQYGSGYLTAASADALFLTPAEGDAAYVNVSGDTMTGALLVTQAAAGTAALRTRVTGDASDHWHVNADGGMVWGPGSGTDTVLYRNSVNSLRTGGDFVVDGSVTAASDLSVSGEIDAFGAIYQSTGQPAVLGGLTAQNPAQFEDTVLLAADPTLALQAATKHYVDTAAAISHYRIEERSTTTSTPISATTAETTVVSPTFDPITTGERIKFRAWGDTLNNSGGTATIKFFLRYASLTGTLILDTGTSNLITAGTRYPWLIELEIEDTTPASDNDFIGKALVGTAAASTRMGTTTMTAVGVNPGVTLNLSSAFQLFLTAELSVATSTDLRIQGYTIERFV